MSRLYPLFVELEGRRVVVVGGGQVAERKVEVLLGCGAEVVLVSGELTEKLAELVGQGQIEVRRRAFCSGDTEGAWLVIAASDDNEVNRQIFAEASVKRIFCNVVDDPSLCSFQVPSVVSRGPLQIAISTGGVSPALAKWIRKELQEEFGEYYETFLAGLGELREHVKSKYPDDQPRRATILEGFVNSEGIELLRAGKAEEFRQLLEEWRRR